MTLYRVELEQTRTAAFYINAPDQSTAVSDADELADGFDQWDHVDDIDVFVAPHTPTNPNSQAHVWTGGPDGEWLTYEAFNASQ